MSDYIDNKKRGGKKNKTQAALKKALLNMLSMQSFSKIAVNDLCEEALLSRSTFYVYFNDKFDLLKYCMDDVKRLFELYAKRHSDMEIIAEINSYVFSNSKLLKNLLIDNDIEVMVLLTDLLTPGLSNILTAREKRDNEMSLSHTVLANFCAGGFANLIVWQIKNNFPVDKELMTGYLYKMQKGIRDLDLEHYE